MKKKPLIIFMSTALFLFAVVFTSTSMAKRCPGAYDIDDYMLDQVVCTDLEGNPTGQEKMDCVSYFEMCCNTSKQTACDQPESEEG